MRRNIRLPERAAPLKIIHVIANPCALAIQKAFYRISKRRIFNVTADAASSGAIDWKGAIRVQPGRIHDFEAFEINLDVA